MKRTILALLALLSWSAGVSPALQAQTTDTVSQATLDSIDAKMKLMKLKEISVTAPKPVYSMTGEVVNYNVENDETVAGLTAFDAIRNAPTVQVDEEGNITMRGSEKVEVWLNGQPTGMNGPTLKAFFESMPAEALARVEVIKNPSAKYMVEDGSHILNIVTSARLRTSQLLIVGLSGNTRPYYSPWFSYVRNTDRMKFSFHLAGSRSHFLSDGSGSDTLYQGGAIASLRSYDERFDGARINGSNVIRFDYKIDSMTDFSLMSWNMLSANYDDYRIIDYDHYDWSAGVPPASDSAGETPALHYRYRDSTSTQSWYLSGFTHFDLKHKFDKQGHNITFGGVWNYFFRADDILAQRLLVLHSPLSVPPLPYDRTSNGYSRRNTFDLSLSYNRPLTESDNLNLRVGFRPYGNTHADRTIYYLDTITGSHSLADSLRNRVTDSYSHRLYFSASWRHEWQRTTLSLDLLASQNWLHIDNTGLFPDDTLYRFFDVEPSLGLTYRTESMHYFRFNYSLSFSNPSGSDLTTTRIYDDDSYSVGNRDLHSSRTHRASLSWNRYFEKIGNAGLEAYANYTTDGIESITATTPGVDPFLGRIVYYSMPYNVSTSFKYGLDANFTYRPAAWASLSLNGSLYHQGFALEGEELQQRLSWNTYVRLWVKVAKLVGLDANISYGTPTIGLYSETERNLTVGLGASATLCDGRLALNVSVSDIFDNNLYQSRTSAPTYASSESDHSALRYVTFGLSWRFGKLDLEWQASGGAAGQ